MSDKTRFSRLGSFVASTVLVCSLGIAALAGGIALSDHASATSQISGSAGKMTDADRYQLMQKGDSFIRLDKKTGRMSICSLDDDNMVCRMAADEREAMESEIDELLARIDELEGRDSRLGKRYGFRYHNDFLSEDDFETTLDRSEKLIRRFYGVMKELGE